MIMQPFAAIEQIFTGPLLKGGRVDAALASTLLRIPGLLPAAGPDSNSE
jgi:hypothetical protein